MEPVVVVILLALLEYSVMGGLVGRARMIHGVKAPATTGHEVFERTYRAHQNTLESLVVFIPAVWIFGWYVHPLWAAGLGVIFIAGRALYAFGYIRAAERRHHGAMLSSLASAVLLFGGLIGVILRMF
jgi:glutathione S-transferase